MQFVDEAVIEVEAGKGGDGLLSFYRARNVPKGGPDGGNGGNGGDVTLVGESALNTLVDFRFTPRCRAQPGVAGGSREKTGANGAGLTVRVPVGTTVIDEETRTVIGDVASSGEKLLVARGGRRGFGNAHFKSSTNRAPRRTTPGKPGERRRLRLALRVIADVGLLGMPNAGKSTLIRRVSASKPKVADYPFTTLIPNLGVVRVHEHKSFVMADVPGILPGASHGTGLGFRFLKHLSRVRLLLHLVDVVPMDDSDPVANARRIEEELYAYSQAFHGRDIWLVATKTDLAWTDTQVRQLRAAFPNRPCHAISAVSGQGVAALLNAVMSHVEQYHARLSDDAAFAEREREFTRQMGDDVLDKSFGDASPKERDTAEPASDHEPLVVYRRG